MSGTHIRFNDDDNDEYEPTDSDDEYSDNEKRLLNKVRKGKQDDSEEDNEVFAVGSASESEDDNASDIALSDVEGQEDKDDLPDIRAWGKDKRKFYATDYVDPDYGGFQGKDAHLAELEEEEARTLQQQLAEQLDDNDFSLDLFGKKAETASDKNINEEVIKTDISKLSKRQKIEILEKESPEFFGLVDDFKLKITLARDYLAPTVELSKRNKVPYCSAIEFVKTHYQLILNYCNNIYAYLLLRASRANVQKHPVIKRLYQYRQLLLKLEPIFEETIKPQLEVLLQELKNNENEKHIEKKLTKKPLKLLSKVGKTIARKSTVEQEIIKNVNEKSKKKLKWAEQVEEAVEEIEEMDIENENVVVDDGKVDDANVSEKREITYQIAKNKGLTPHRKKEQRNPRVKHRNKFRKAKIRRKGAVREVRHELSRYGGEMSGIKAGVVKSVKIKS